MKKNKVLVQNSITYAIVIACWILVQILGATGHMTSLLKGLLVPLCIYVILAVSLMEKWNPLESRPTYITLMRFLMISPKARVTIAR